MESDMTLFIFTGRSNTMTVYRSSKLGSACLMIEAPDVLKPRMLHTRMCKSLLLKLATGYVYLYFVIKCMQYVDYVLCCY